MSRQKKHDAAAPSGPAAPLPVGRDMAPAVEESLADGTVVPPPADERPRFAPPDPAQDAALNDALAAAPAANGPPADAIAGRFPSDAVRAKAPFSRSYYAVLGTLHIEDEGATTNETTVLFEGKSLSGARKWVKGNRMFTRRLFDAISIVRAKVYLGTV